MHVDYLTLACLKNDLDRMEDARIQQVVLPDENAVALELYAGFRRTLLLDAGTRHARALLYEEKARRGVDTESPLGLLLKKHVRGGRLRAVHQPAFERILELEIENEAGRSTLVAEIMGRSSNLLLLDEERVIRECTRRAGLEQNPYRVTLPAYPYTPPPPLSKRPPTELDESDWQKLLASTPPDTPLHRLLVRELAGISPTLAREIASRANYEPEAPVADVEAIAVLDAVEELFAPPDRGEWEPSVAFDEEGTVIAFAPYELTQFEQSERVLTVSEAMLRYFAARMDIDAYAAARRQVATLLSDARDRVQGILHQLHSQKLDPAEVERLRENGELLLAYQWQVPPGAHRTEVPDYLGQPRQITLDPERSAVENAQRYFARYEKKKRALEEIPPRIQTAEQDLEFLDALEADLEQAEERPEIDAVKEALIEAGFQSSRKRRRGGGGVVRGPRRVHLGDWIALVGRNSQQNDDVTFRLAASDDLWLHARGVPGSHVILKSAGRELPERIVEQAASLAAYYSRARGSTDVAVDVTEKRHVRRISGSRPGLVTYRNERTLHVKPLSAETLEEEA